MSASTPTDGQRMFGMISGLWVANTVRAVAILNIAEHLARGPATAEEIAALAATDPDATARLMRVCASIDLVTYDASTKRFATTSLLDTLRRDAPGSQYGLAVGVAGYSQSRPWVDLAEVVRTGARVTPKVLGAGTLGLQPGQPRRGPGVQRDDGRAHRTHRPGGRATGRHVGHLGRRRRRRGGGCLPARADGGEPAAPRGQRAQVVPLAEQAAVQRGLEERFTTVAGDFFTAVPEGDLFVVKHDLHDWDDDDCVTILRTCRMAMRPGGRVAIIEQVLRDIGQESAQAPLMDLNMLVQVPGRERTLADSERLVNGAGLRLHRVIPAPELPFQVIEAVVPR